ncbi:type VI secretion system lipoprotein TssJ [Rhodopila globiformis]|uniref:Type VI secretion system-associated lipoprotein n=1 Tax=Rhodopila globiformis TaxID=1071 RepID=A0A2S6NFJ2_RHOGL|nr:type VI secretion system lipoprotein TssJ [Rhodopila globiformis]PPQ33354.1 type VI secretion system-associated lipoprotein [Rhodopila globiformis]
MNVTGRKPGKRYGGSRARLLAARRGLLLICVQLSACSSDQKSPEPPPPPVVMLSLAGSTDQNPDINGAASPVDVRIIQLVEPHRFEYADAYAFLDSERKALGSDEAATQDVFVNPSERRSIRIDPKPGVTAIGIAALYRDIDNAQWRAVAPIATHGTTKLSATIGRLAVTLRPAP